MLHTAVPLLQRQLRESGYFVLDVSPLSFHALASAAERVGDAEPWMLPALRDQLASLPSIVAEQESPILQKLIGEQLLIQSKPYLRIVRPGVAADAIGMHRDTWYGASPDEFSISIALSDQDEGSALRIAPGSHHDHERPVIARSDRGCERGSDAHKNGQPYAPKREIDPPSTIPIPLQIGQALIFSIAAYHGQEINTSSATRITMDARLADASKVKARQTSSAGEYYTRLVA